MSELNKNYYHVGRQILEHLKRNGKSVCVIDAATGQTYTKESILNKSVALAKCMRRMGMEPNEVVVLGGRNHIDLRIPYYAGLMLGCPIAGVDPLFKLDELKNYFNIVKPKIAFCQRDRYDDNVAAAKELGLVTRVVTFDDGEHSIKRFFEEFNGNDDEEFEITEIDPTSTYAWLVPTSGSTGIPKVAAFVHKVVAEIGANALPVPEQELVLGWLAIAPVSWVSSYIVPLTVLHNDSFSVSTSAELTSDALIHIVNTYKPNAGLINPTYVASILQNPNHCDFNCFRGLAIGGSRVHHDLIHEIRTKYPKAGVFEVYGQTELCRSIFRPSPAEPPSSIGKLKPYARIKLVDPETQEEVIEPNQPGELWVHKNTVKFDCYYNMPEETARAFSADGTYYKTGDLLKRDEDGNYYFVDRVKMMMKYRGTHILPKEIEDVIHSHPSVSQVVALPIPDPERMVGDLPVACVVLRTGCTLTAHEIKGMVREKLSVNKQLYGGVVFLDEFPLTSNGKVALAQLKEIVMNAKRE